MARIFFKLHAGVKKCHFDNFSDRAWMAGHCLFGPQESLTGFQKFFLHWVPMNSYQCWKAELERAHFLKVQSGKTTVCKACVKYFLSFHQKDISPEKTETN